MNTTIKLILELRKLRKKLIPKHSNYPYSIKDVERLFSYKNNLYNIIYIPSTDIMEVRIVFIGNKYGSVFKHILYKLSSSGFYYDDGHIPDNEIGNLIDIHDDTQLVLAYGRNAYINPDFLKEIEKLNDE